LGIYYWETVGDALESYYWGEGQNLRSSFLLLTC
jgi:hypothetical protein